jgi:hypothetical protein
MIALPPLVTLVLRIVPPDRTVREYGWGTVNPVLVTPLEMVVFDVIVVMNMSFDAGEQDSSLQAICARAREKRDACRAHHGGSGATRSVSVGSGQAMAQACVLAGSDRKDSIPGAETIVLISSYPLLNPDYLVLRINF